MVKYTPEQQISAFWNKVNKNGPIPSHCPELGHCWEWIASKLPKGYGMFQNMGSHRYSWILAYGEIPNNLFVLHKCDNPSCVNPTHLFLGTNQDNVDDMMKKNRTPKGETHHSSKLSDRDINEIRLQYANGDISQRKLASIYKISHSMVSRIVTLQRRK